MFVVLIAHNASFGRVMAMRNASFHLVLDRFTTWHSHQGEVSFAWSFVVGVFLFASEQGPFSLLAISSTVMMDFLQLFDMILGFLPTVIFGIDKFMPMFDVTRHVFKSMVVINTASDFVDRNLVLLVHKAFTGPYAYPGPAFISSSAFIKFLETSPE